MSRAAAASLLLLCAAVVRPAAAAAQWPVGQGAYWAKASFFWHSTTRRYGPDGRSQRYLNQGAESRAAALFLDLAYGITDRLDLWLQLPYFDLSFDDVTMERDAAGVGDVRLSTRYTLSHLLGGAVPLSVRAAVKAPIQDFPIDAEIIPIGEGQWDLEAWAEAGLSLWPTPAYAVLWLGYRWRLWNPTTTRDPGDELLLLAEIGGRLLGRLGGKVVLDGVWGRDGRLLGVPLSADAREILYLQPVLSLELPGSSTVELGGRLPLRGQNFPAGPQLLASVFHRGRVCWPVACAGGTDR
ncbi:MAG: hypothetical protein HY703_05250 [Gemmatimonadetes bacterium]|nr:hypothetical protein [Gemmatimonadota bacterium]